MHLIQSKFTKINPNFFSNRDCAPVLEPPLFIIYIYFKKVIESLELSVINSLTEKFSGVHILGAVSFHQRFYTFVQVTM